MLTGELQELGRPHLGLGRMAGAPIKGKNHFEPRPLPAAWVSSSQPRPGSSSSAGLRLRDRDAHLAGWVPGQIDTLPRDVFS